MKNSVAVIGGGASGLVAAIFAAQSGADVTVYESGERVGRKILATGNGRCNMTNINADTGNYHGKNPKFILGAKNKFWTDKTIEFFSDLGIVVKVEEDGKVYPYSDRASDVLDVLRFKMNDLGIRVVNSFEASKVIKNNGKFDIVSYDGRKESADRVIIATGGKAAPNLGSKGGGYDILKSLGHTVTKLSPSLVQIKTETDVVRKLKGIKLNADVTLGKYSEYGEVLFTEYGLSGPAVFSLSSRLNEQKTISLDIMREYSKDRLFEMLTSRIYRNPKIALENFFVGMFNKRVGQALLKFAGIEPLSRYAVTLSEKEISRVCGIIKKWDFNITGTMSWNNAQVTKGGVSTDEFNPSTMESRLVKNLYAAGEILDIDGDCGGYNLQWAWSSGCLAGISAGTR
ncbi:MAG: NAD(P)/FAD-dependent oxidoreductase [Oscillospiraceae bacterium]|nr:NAD(P)/FAD-dependent oxidoreductase [Oscillospiraceae bacterium]